MLPASRPWRPGRETILSTGRPDPGQAPGLARYFRLVDGKCTGSRGETAGCAATGFRGGELFCSSG